MASFDELRQRASKADAEAQFNLAMRYAGGVEIEKSDIEAVRWLKLAVEAGTVRAAFHELAFHYQRGAGIEKDEAKAAELFKRAADEGNLPSLEQIGLCLKTGRGIGQDVPAAIQYFTEGVEQQDPACEYQLAMCFREGLVETCVQAEDRDAECTRLLGRAAKQNHAESVFQFAKCLQSGLGLQEADPSAAVSWYHRAVDQNHVEAMFQLGKIYHHGTGIEPDARKAMQFYLKAAQNNFSDAFYEIGRRYEEGDGVTSDQQLAAQWYRRAADLDHLVSLINLYNRLRTANGVLRNDVEFIHYATRAALLGHRESQVIVASRYQVGCATGLDEEKALKYWHLSSEIPVPSSAELIQIEQHNAVTAQSFRQLGTLYARQAISIGGCAAEKAAAGVSVDHLIALPAPSAAVTTPTKSNSNQPRGSPTASPAASAWDHSFRAFMQAAQLGCLTSQLCVADAYMSGNRGARKNEVDAVRYWYMAATEHDSEANPGDSSDTDYADIETQERAVAYYNLALSLLSAIASSSTTAKAVLEMGCGVTQKREAAMAAAARKAEQERIEAEERAKRYAKLGFKAKDTSDANTPASQTPLLSVDSSFSQFQLPDDAEIQRTIDQLLGKAAAAGVAAAQTILGQRLFVQMEAIQAQFNAAFKSDEKEKLQLQIDETGHKAFDLLLSAASQGECQAQFDVALCYKDGKGCPVDEAEAVKWMRKASKQAEQQMEQITNTAGKSPVADSNTESAEPEVLSIPGLTAAASYTRLRIDTLRKLRTELERKRIEQQDAECWEASRAFELRLKEQKARAEEEAAAAAYRQRKKVARIEELHQLSARGREALRAEETKRELEMQKLDNFAQREIISLVTDLPPPATSNMSVAMRSAAHDVLAQEFKPSVEKVIDAKVTREELLTQLSALDVSATSHVPAVATTSAFALKNSPTAQLLQAALPDLKQKIQQILSDDRQKFEESMKVVPVTSPSLYLDAPLPSDALVFKLSSDMLSSSMWSNICDFLPLEFLSTFASLNRGFSKLMKPQTVDDAGLPSGQDSIFHHRRFAVFENWKNSDKLSECIRRISQRCSQLQVVSFASCPGARDSHLHSIGALIATSSATAKASSSPQKVQSEKTSGIRVLRLNDCQFTDSGLLPILNSILSSSGSSLNTIALNALPALTSAWIPLLTQIVSANKLNLQNLSLGPGLRYSNTPHEVLMKLLKASSGLRQMSLDLHVSSNSAQDLEYQMNLLHMVCLGLTSGQKSLLGSLKISGSQNFNDVASQWMCTLIQKSPDLTDLEFDNCQITDNVCIALLNTFVTDSSSRLRRLAFSKCALVTDAVLLKLCELHASFSELRQLDISNSFKITPVALLRVRACFGSKLSIRLAHTKEQMVEHLFKPKPVERVPTPPPPPAPPVWEQGRPRTPTNYDIKLYESMNYLTTNQELAELRARALVDAREKGYDLSLETFESLTAVASAEATSPKKAVKSGFFSRFPVKVWSNITNFLPFSLVHTELSVLSKQFFGELAKQVLPLRRTIEVQDATDRVKLSALLRNLKSHGSCKGVSGFQFTSCAALDPQHLQTIAEFQPTSLYFDNCCNITDRGLTSSLGPSLLSICERMESLVLRRFTVCASAGATVLDSLADAFQEGMRTATVRPVLRRLHLIDLPLSMCAEQTLVRLLFKVAPTPSDKSARRSRVLDPQLINRLLDEHAAADGGSGSSRDRLIELGQRTMSAGMLCEEGGAGFGTVVVKDSSKYVSPLVDVRLERGKLTGPTANETGADFVTDNVLLALRGASQLRYLSLAGSCEWSDDAFSALLHSVGKTLIELDLSRCKHITDATLDLVAVKCVNLQRLSIAFCALVTGNGVEVLLNGCEKLMVFDIRHTYGVSAQQVKRVKTARPRLDVVHHIVK